MHGRNAKFWCKRVVLSTILSTVCNAGALRSQICRPCPGADPTLQHHASPPLPREQPKRLTRTVHLPQRTMTMMAESTLRLGYHSACDSEPGTGAELRRERLRWVPILGQRYRPGRDHSAPTQRIT